MTLQHGLFTLALSAMFLAPVAARADDDSRRGARHDASPVGHDTHGEHLHTGGCYHPAPTPPPPEPPRSHHRPRHSGRYELQTVQQWVPGRYEQVWVEQNCKYKPHRNVTKCKGGYYDQRWVPGHYQAVQEWVWVAGRHRGYAVAHDGR